jgi:hypothetical protein
MEVVLVPSETVHRATAVYVRPIVRPLSLLNWVDAELGDEMDTAPGFESKVQLYVLAPPVPPDAVMVTALEKTGVVSEPPYASPDFVSVNGEETARHSIQAPPERRFTEVTSVIEPVRRRRGVGAFTQAPPDLR